MPIRSVTLAFLIAIVASSAATAADNQEREWRAACTHDAFVHCTTKALAGDRSGVRDCLVQHLAKISARCRDLVNGGIRTIDAPVWRDAVARSSASDKSHRSN